MGKFVRAAMRADIPEGEGKAIALGETEIALFNLGGEFFALNNVCPHRGGSLGSGAVDGEIVICPLHGWGIDPITGRAMNNSDCTVRLYPVRVVDGEVEINIDP